MTKSYAQVTWEDYARAEQFLPWNAYKRVFNAQVRPNWIEESNRFWYLNRTRNGREFVLVNPSLKAREPVFDHVRLASALSLATGASYQHNKLPFESFEFVDDCSAVRFDVEGRRWTCDLETYRCVEAEKGEAASEGELLSPDGCWAAFTRDYNVYVRSVETGEEIELTGDGEPHYRYATSPDSNTKAVTQRLSGKPSRPIAIWSPDSRRILTHKLDERRVEEMPLIQSVPKDGSVRPLVHFYRYPIPGDEEVPLAELVILEIEGKKRVDVEYEPNPVIFLSSIEIKGAWWSKDSERVYFIFRERGDKALRLCEVDASTGATRTILEERGSTHIEPHFSIAGARPNVRILGGGREVIWFSQRDGWAHLYLYDGKSGAFKHQITSGSWVVRDIVHVDEENRRIYFTAGGREEERDPYYRHLYGVNVDGGNLQLLTPEEADHEVTFSPTGGYFVDTYSRVDAPPVSVLRDADGQIVCKLEEADVELLVETGWRWPERFTVKARDGITDLYGVIYHPTTFDPTAKYPVLDAIYPGPQVIQTPKSFPADPFSSLRFWEPQTLAELGFVVVTVDGLGTPLRSKAFHDGSYGNLGEVGGLPDHIAALRQLAATHRYMDLSRVGIYGHSGGGNASVRAILSYPDFYKVAVSSAGNHDQRGYLAGWGEKYQGMLNGDNYMNQVNASLAMNLEGKLLLVYGDMDDNVQPALTIQLVDALIKANKDFDLLVLPNRNHKFKTDPYFNRKRWDYFVQHMLSQTPPKGYKIQEPDPEFMTLLEREF